MAKAIIVELEGCGKVISTTEFPSLKRAVYEMTQVWGLYKCYHKRARIYEGWLMTAEGPKFASYVLHTMTEWNILRDSGAYYY